MYTLSPIKEELDVVKFIYDKYLQCKSINQVFIYVFQKNIKTKNGADFNKKTNSTYIKKSPCMLEQMKLL